MRKFFKDVKGAVTVMVTLLLIPALLVTGSGVDIARIYTARSILQDGNQLAANAVLTQYDAMLQDVYGLFAVASTDEDLQKMVTDYVNVCLYGDGETEGSLGSLRLFYGEQAQAQIKKVQNLGQIEVLRHQIEEYAKFRAPVAIGMEILEKLESFQKVKNDSEAIQDKMELDKHFSNLQKVYQELYDAIEATSGARGNQETIVGEINSYLKLVNGELDEMVSLREEYVEVFDKSESEEFYRTEKLKAIEDTYAIHMSNIKKIVSNSGQVNRYKAKGGYETDSGEWVAVQSVRGAWLKGRGLNSYISASRDGMKEYLGKYDTMVEKAKAVDAQAANLRTEIEELEKKLESCSDELRTGLQNELSTYKRMLAVSEQYDVTDMAVAVSGYNKEKINTFNSKIDAVIYGCIGDDNNPLQDSRNISRSGLTSLNKTEVYAVDAPILNRGRSQAQKIDLNRLSGAAKMGTGTYYYNKNADPIKAFNDGHFDGTGNSDFYEILKELCQEADKKKQDNVKKNIGKMMDAVQDKLKEALDGVNIIPQGAGYYGSRTQVQKNGFGLGDDWSDTDKASDASAGAMSEVGGFGDVLANGLDAIVDKALLVTYDSEMFSCYTSENTAQGGKPQTSMSGIPIDTQVNYFYQSELEFLFNGNLQSAEMNLLAVSGTLLTVRLVFNYLASFSIQSVNTVVSAVRNACAGVGGPIGALVGVALGELARLAMALGESVFDVINLRKGDNVPLIKNNSTWLLSVQGLANTASNAAVSFSVGENKSDATGVSYRDYLRIFLLVLVPENVLAQRTGRLIEINMNNIKNSVYGAGTTIYGKEGSMGGKSDFKLSGASTALEINSSVSMRFLFFPMGVFRNAVDTAPPTEFQITAVDYRGY